ncbi:MAG: D-alanine--D-alanine ligase, partial [Defluviitaleaceae bacterium]|nr:D-alanine--D-alanine ligase [Defluviitaleaceae bacterium]
AMDKAFANQIARKLGIKQADWLEFSKSEIDKDIEAVAKRIRYKIGYPCFVKPANTGSSVGISKAKNKKELINALYEAAKHDKKIVVEKSITGRELECAVIGNDEPMASGVGEIVVTAHEFYSYEAKYNCNTTKTLVSADILAEAKSKVQEISLQIYKALGCAGLSRVDFFLTPEGEVFFNEINTMPGFTQISMYPMLWSPEGITTSQLVEKLIEYAMTVAKNG